MPVLKNARHEKFAQALATGMPAIEAYGQAGYKPDRGAATRLSAKVSIRHRVTEIQGRAAEKAAVTIQSLTEELEEARAIALAEKQSSAAVAATMGKAKLHGLIVERKQHSGPNGGPLQILDVSRLKGMTKEELEALERALVQIGLAEGDPERAGEPQE